MQTRRLRPDENLIFHLIESQSSTLETALRELVQNAYDAGATRCDLELTVEGFRVRDDGRGFANVGEIERFFETFGTPHAEDYTEKFGRFRMGRCQIMAFAPTVWRSNEFTMAVDIRDRGLDYDLQTDQSPFVGCEISGTWYTSLPNYHLTDVEDSLCDCFEFFYRLPVFLNGKRISKNLEELAITVETDEFYIIQDEQRPELTVYNLGVYVGPLLHQGRWQLRGVLLSKIHLPLDISRSHWLTHRCEIWKRLDGVLRKQFPPIHRKGKLTSAQIQSVFYELRERETTIAEIRTLKLFHDPQRTQTYSLWDLCHDRQFTFAIPDGNLNLADKLSQWGGVLVLSLSEISTVFEAPTFAQIITNFFRCLTDQGNSATEPWVEGNCIGQQVADEVINHYVAFEEAAQGYNPSYEFVAEEALTPVEVCALKALRRANELVLRRVARYRYFSNLKAHQRKVFIGLSPTAEAWTDGINYIVVNRALLARLNRGVHASDYLAAVLVHEWCHSVANPGEHNAEFYRCYHDLTCHPTLRVISSLALEINSNYARYLRAAGLTVTPSVQKHLTGASKEPDTQRRHSRDFLRQFGFQDRQLSAVERYLHQLYHYVRDPEKADAEKIQELLGKLASLDDEYGFKHNIDWYWLQVADNPEFWEKLYATRHLSNQVGPARKRKQPTHKLKGAA